MSIKRNLCASICVNFLIMGIFLLMIQQLDVFMQLLFSFAPILVSIIVTAVINCNKNALVVKVVVSKTLKLLLHSFRLSDDTPYLP